MNTYKSYPKICNSQGQSQIFSTIYVWFYHSRMFYQNHSYLYLFIDFLQASEFDPSYLISSHKDFI